MLSETITQLTQSEEKPAILSRNSLFLSPDRQIPVSERAYKDLIHLPEYITAEAWSASDAYSQTTLQAVYI